MVAHSGLITVMDRAARKAAPRLRRDFNEVQQLQVSRKGPADFVSMADKRAEETLYEELKKARPDWGFLMEEAGEIEGDPTKPRWIVDPLDGTSNFLHGLPHFAIITRDTARALFGDEHAVGKTIYQDSEDSAVVIGVMENMLGAWVGWDKLTQVMLIPRIQAGPLARYVVRTELGQRDALMAEVEKKLSNNNPNRAITFVRSHEKIKERSYRADSRMVAFLGVLIGLMISVTALGIVGLASFLVSVRRKQIGTRRAVGARRIDIIRYFMLENWLLTTGGVIAGTVLAFAFGQWLSSAYSLPRLPPTYVAGGVAVLWLLGQLAAFLPARRAAAIPPAIATRTV